MGERPGEAYGIAVEGRPAPRVSSRSPDDNGFTGDIGAAMPAVIRGQSRSGEERLDAALPAAITRGTRQFVRLRPGQGVVPPFARDRVDAHHDPAVDHDPAANAGAEDRPENIGTSR